MEFLQYRDFILTEAENFKMTYLLPIDWWSVWKEENKDKYKIEVNAIDKTYEITDTESGNTIFVYDYNRQKVFTNEKPEFFKIEDENITPAELTKVADKEKKKIEPEPPKDKPKEKKDDPLADLGLDKKTEEE